MDSKVYVTQENTALNYLPAEDFGEIVFITRNDFSPIRNSLSNVELINDIERALKSFNPDVDYITVSGSPVVAAVVFMVLAKKTKHVQILRWSNRDRLYQPIYISL